MQNHWVSATINPDHPQEFTFHRRIEAANVLAYTSPA
jgi:hypothetical protein